MQRFSDKIILISGGLGDIALATAEAFGKEGAYVALSDIQSADNAIEKLQTLIKLGIAHDYTQVDISNSKSVEAWVLEVANSKGKIDIAVVNAATVTIKNIASLTSEEWNAEISVNLNGAFHLAQKVAIHQMSQNIKGNIVFLGSWAAHAVHTHIPAYSVSKAGIRMLCQCFALEFAPFGIRVNEIAPGYVNAGLSKVVWASDSNAQEKARQTVPLKRLIEAEEVASNIVWLCSDENRHVTGNSLVMDGGLSLVRP